MGKLKKQRYNNAYLLEYCSENNITLRVEYRQTIVNSETRIHAKCVYEKCLDDVNKAFSVLVKFGCYCKNHTASLGQVKRKATSIKKYGFANPMQNKEVQEKFKQTCLEKWGVEYPMRNAKVQETRKQACLENWGVENPMQNAEVQEKRKQTSLENWGVEHPMQNAEVQEKRKQTSLENWGVEHPMQNAEVQETRKQACLENWGVEHPMQNAEVQETRKQACLENWGVEYTFQNKEIQKKSKQTCLEHWGAEHPMQNAEVADKSSKNAYKSYEYTFPSGRIEKIQGYEKFMLDELLNEEYILEDDIFVKRSEMPLVWYLDDKGKKHRYYVDCLIKSQNRCIEAKSTWTALKKKDSIYLKQQALKSAGYECEIWIYNAKGEKVEIYK